MTGWPADTARRRAAVLDAAKTRIAAAIAAGELPRGVRSLTVMRHHGVTRAALGITVDNLPHAEDRTSVTGQLLTWMRAQSPRPAAVDAAALPKYQRVAAEMRADITAGRYQPGDRLPSESALRDRFAVALPTLRQAVGVLRSEGLLESHHGIGTFVCSAEPPAIAPTPEQREREAAARALEQAAAAARDLMPGVPDPVVHASWLEDRASAIHAGEELLP